MFVEQGHDELTVTFYPPLHLQRRAWVLDVLRRERVHMVLDVGCGEGELISCLCNPAPWLPPPSLTVPDSLSTSGIPGDILSLPLTDINLHPAKVVGLDISAADLKYAVESTAPESSSGEDCWTGTLRWEPLEVKIWEGDLQSINPEFVNVECIVSTEVIEHLPEGVLQNFAPIMLGVYHPRLLLITSPSYTFNARFTRPNAPKEARNGYPDPTGRTTRIFRHHDHKFEWTVQEFTEWCNQIADEWGYEAQIGGVGKARENDEWGRDDELGWASQVAAFRRREGDVYEDKRNKAVERMSNPEARTELKLLATHHHHAHEKAGQPALLDEIRRLLASEVKQSMHPSFRLGELWYKASIAKACGGWLEVLLAVIRQEPALHLRRMDSSTVLDWQIELEDWSPPGVPFWGQETQYEGQDGSSISSDEQGGEAAVPGDAAGLGEAQPFGNDPWNNLLSHEAEVGNNAWVLAEVDEQCGWQDVVSSWGGQVVQG
ncbi:uncharacterized protein LAESUDRAFT_716802 [Laetiporus sulphureus 93-53]|uniref:Small RNA 2'-O-methyltransferase n=1 Tax=Laetiporus sulphureus 93-53 TaxID=1314785 RepID=A0A165CD69_9APHY|nr:uncharacterized protein LAESUDRAFT_716802 [Laetiporus sulphureus 93-53]KZT02600.1 hypothetical protein LAESUDRAFT_716802 [Laetiporus sulphureus 93-53]